MPLQRNFLLEVPDQVTVEHGKISVEEENAPNNPFNSSKNLRILVTKFAGKQKRARILDEDDPRIACFLEEASLSGEGPDWMEAFMNYARSIHSISNIGYRA
ncbi:hypothetical protein BGZ97_002638 [Linnemannia gamsii]|jgi:hypothetical protein|uniref:Uncharacterized protein n=1 Tax=Linnemannia gamsii TaxID=64522 RepID=A0A9P6UTP1_9FUNG|nr:hypothetical protein BGZ97_002638 [Linnemannia gamsii]